MKEVLDMATSSITKNFIVSGTKQVEMFANAVEESYQESLRRKPSNSVRATYVRDPEEAKAFLLKRK